ncbi:MAG: hypothetical protein ACJ8R9_32760, partial [Steroidobacteraceae bacterium]
MGEAPKGPNARHGLAACGERVAKDGHPGLARSMECAAQWRAGSELQGRLLAIAFSRRGRTPAMGSPHAASGWPRMATLGLREAWNAQRNGGPDLSSRDGS